MPKKEIDYQNTIIYKIACNDLNVKDVYVVLKFSKQVSTVKFTDFIIALECSVFVVNAKRKFNLFRVRNFPINQFFGLNVIRI